ncbi:MAG TPA: hypothetical protein VG477_18180 [Thermoanaerobaculia bacterium]|nr:hypothetical protein [Thermoanaerobaculia bacterium]
MKKKLLFLTLVLAAVTGILPISTPQAEAWTCGYNVCTTDPDGTRCCEWCCLDDNGKIITCSDRPTICS